MRTLLIVLSLTLAAVGAESKTTLLQNVPLQWKPTSELQLGAVQMSMTPIQFEPFLDSRDDKQSIGENVEKDTPKPVTTSDDVGAYVGTHMRALFDKAGLKTVDSDGSVIIKGEVKQFFVREDSTYKSDVVIHLTVVNRAGKTLWTGLVSGDATRFGRSYKLENYYEVLSDAIVNTVSSMLGNAEFQKALAAQ